MATTATCMSALAGAVGNMVDKFINQVHHQGGLRSATVVDHHLTIETGKEVAMVAGAVRCR
jgi:phage anti-repressor protein